MAGLGPTTPAKITSLVWCLDPGTGVSLRRVSKHEYGFVSSKPLGRDQYKEMYLFVYR